MQQSDIAEAEDYIFEALRNGPRRVRDLAKGTAISLRTLERAGRRLGIRRSRVSEGGAWVWHLDAPARLFRSGPR